jgi:sugar phosphate isomerase/epimerase
LNFDGFSLEESIRTIRELDFPVIEIQCMGELAGRPGKYPGFLFDQLTSAEKKKIAHDLRGFRTVTAHLPYTGLNYISTDSAKRESSVRTLETAMDGAGHFGARVAVLHPQPLEASEEGPRWEEYLNRFRVWGDRAKKLGFRLALETGYPRSIKQYVRLIQEINHPQVGSTIDVGHQRTYQELVARIKPEQRGTPEGIRAYNDTTFAIMDGLGPKLFHFHVHDIEPATWAEHKPLVHGFVDYPRLFAKLKALNYQGNLIFEIGGPPAQMAGALRDGKRKLEGWMSRAI